MMAHALQEYTHPVKSSPGIYFDPIGKLKINVGRLDIVTAYDVSYIEPHIENINSILGTVRFLCNQIQMETMINLECHNTLEPLSVKYNDIVSAYSSISHLIGSKRFKRAWIGAVGTLSKTIFGTLDEDDAIKYDNAIQNVQDNEKRLSSLIKESILVTTTTLSKFNETLHKIKINEASLDEAVNNLSLKLKNISKISIELNYKSNIDSILTSLEASLLTLSFQMEDITNAILFSSRNTLHPAILPPKQLYKELVDNYRYLPTNVKLPISLELRNIHLLLNVSSITCYSLNDKIIFVLRLPLVSPREYELFHNIALPTPHDDVNPSTFSLIRPSNKFIAMTKDKTEYCNLDSLTDCQAINANDYICNIMSVFSTSAHPNCESELMSKTISVLPVQCQTDFLSGTLDLWKPISDNKWIYIQSQNNKVYLDCINQKIVELDIVGTGILEVPQNCMAFCKTTKLVPRFSGLKLNISVPRLNFDLIKDPCCILDKFKNEISNEPPIQLQNIDLDIFTSETSLKLKSMSREADKILNQHQIIKYGTHYSIFIILMFTLICIYCTFKIFLCIKSQRLSYRFPNLSQPTQDNQDNHITLNPINPVNNPKSSEDSFPTKLAKLSSEEIPSPSIRVKV